MAFLQGPSLKQEEVLKQELGEGPGDLERCIRDLRSMLAASPYLPDPELVDIKVLQLFVRGCRLNMDRTRTKLETYFLSRSRHRDLYEYRSLNEPPLKDTCKFMDVVPLPKVTDEGYRVTILRIRQGYPESSADITNVVRAILLVSDVRIHDETFIAGDVFIWEASHIRASLAARVMAAANAVRRSIHLAQAAYPQRLKRIHVVGAPYVFASSLQLMRSCVNEKIRRRYYIHPHTSELLDHIPARVLPVEWGGEEESIDTLARKWRNRVEDMRDTLRNLSMDNTTPGPLLDQDIYGTVGAFRKLDID
ncbi:alpha-tocopherol transfer protein-like [Aphomia sociella]